MLPMNPAPAFPASSRRSFLRAASACLAIPALGSKLLSRPYRAPWQRPALA